MKHLILIIILFLTSCSSISDEKNPINRSILLDTGTKIGIEVPGVPIPLPKIDINFHFNWRRMTPKNEIDLELAKNGKFRQSLPIELPKTGPTPPISGAK